MWGDLSREFLGGMILNDISAMSIGFGGVVGMLFRLDRLGLGCAEILFRLNCLALGVLFSSSDEKRYQKRQP